MDATMDIHEAARLAGTHYMKIVWAQKRGALPKRLTGSVIRRWASGSPGTKRTRSAKRAPGATATHRVAQQATSDPLSDVRELLLAKRDRIDRILRDLESV